MQHIASILDAFSFVDADFERQRAAAIDSGDCQKAFQIEELQRLNEQAYFILCWGQLEAGLRRTVRNRPQQERRNFARRSFGSKVEIAFGKDSPESRWLMVHYRQRNRIAHGELLAEHLDLVNIVGDFCKILGALAR